MEGDRPPPPPPASSSDRRSSSAALVRKERSRGGKFLLAAAALFFFAGYFFNSDHYRRRRDHLNGVDDDIRKRSDDADADDAVLNASAIVSIRDEPVFNSTFVSYLVSGMKVRLARDKLENNVNRSSRANGRRKQYRYESHYLERWPDSELPKWARKIVPFNRRIAADDEVCFVHVGKAGGSTVGCMLGFSLHCETDDVVESILPAVTTHTLHRGVNDCATDNSGYYLFVVRDPLARMLSDMNYERPNATSPHPYRNTRGFGIKALYEDCGFRTLDDLARRGLIVTSSNAATGTEADRATSDECRSVARDAVTGVGKYLVHGYFNYQYYAQFAFGTEGVADDESTVPENAKLLVVRNDRMAHDWNAINEFLGGRSGSLGPGDVPANNAHAKNATELYLGDESRAALCQALCNEIQVYKDLIRRAINLDDFDVRATLVDLEGVCPREAMEDDGVCKEARPDIRRKIEEKKGCDYY